MPTTPKLQRFSFFLSLLLLLNGSCGDSQEKLAPVDFESLSLQAQRQAEHALAGVDIAPGLTASVFAAEPMLLNPTNIDIDSKGRIWVCEAFNYRNQLNPNNPVRKKGDRIVILDDTNGDGKADKSTTFYQGPEINSALGICVLEDRVIVSVSPHVFVFRDTDGDDKADTKEIMFQGIGGVQHDHGVHAFTFGPDGKLYFNFGNEGKQLLDKDGKQVIDIHGFPVIANTKPFNQGMIFRCDIDGSNVEVVAHNFRNNYELAVDAFGTIWQSDNDDDGNRGTRINYVMEYGNYGFKDERTGAAWRAYRTGMSEEIPFRHWHLNDPGVVPNMLQTGAGSPTGIIIYEGTLLADSFQNTLIHCDAGPNVVRAYPVKSQGAGYSASIRNLMKGEKDQWFRPSDICVAPDGSLFVADWYDPGVGGHQMGDSTRGRIYRLAPKAGNYKIPPQDLSTISGAIEALKSPNLSIRSAAWRKLNKAGESAETALKELWNSDNDIMRARAFWLLSKIKGKEGSYILEAISDANPNIKILGIRAAKQNGVDLLKVLATLHKDPNPQVRREVAINLRFIDSQEAANIWADLAIQAPLGDRWYIEALGIGSDLSPTSKFNAWKKKTGNEWNKPIGKEIVWRSRAHTAIPLLASLINNSRDQKEIGRYFRAFDFHESPKKNETLEDLIKSKHPDQERITFLAISHMSPSFIKKSGKARRNLNRILKKEYNSENYLNLVRKLDLKNEGKRVYQMAINHVGTDLGNKATGLLRHLDQLTLFTADFNRKNEADKLIIIKALGQAYDNKADKMLADIATNEREHTQIRKEALAQLGNSWSGMKSLYNLVSKGKLSEELKQAGATRLLTVGRDSYRSFAADFLKLDEKHENLAPISELITKTGDPAKGHETFKLSCSSCHKVNGEGIDYGPDLSEIGSKLPKAALYASIMNPSAGISFGYEGFLINKKDGNKLLGYIASETNKEIVLRMVGGNDQIIPIKEIKSRIMIEESLMTPYLHTSMTEEELVDLIEFLSHLKKQADIALR